ncbi:MAG: glycine cleavage system aminomethyltransferase GcvT [Rhodoglobus sp.]
MTDVSSSQALDPQVRYSPLHAIHEELGASFTDFAGWMMPVRYSSDLAEHHAVRSAAGIFDISHMAEIRVRGADAGAFLDFALAGKLSATTIGQAKYSLLLAETGGIIDDLVVYRLADDDFLVVANAGNRFAAAQALSERATDFEVSVSDDSDDYALIAVQGPVSRAILEATEGLAGFETPLSELKYYRQTAATFGDHSLIIARTGYTGEDGFELYIHPDAAAELWHALTQAGQPFDLVPAGLACRDTLRLEAGMPLYGHELSLTTFPVQAGLGKVVALSKEGNFVGRQAVEAGPGEGARVLVGLRADGRRAGRAGYSIFSGDTVVGEITSGALSPTLGYPVAIAAVDPKFCELGTELDIDVRGSRIAASVVSLPFYKREA